MATVIGEHVVDSIIRNELDLPQLSKEATIQDQFRTVLFRNERFIKGFGFITVFKHNIMLKLGPEPTCVPYRRRSSKEKEMERECTGR